VVEISTIVHMTANVAAVHAAVAMLPDQMGMARTRSLTTETAMVGGAVVGVETDVQCPDAEVLPIFMNGGLLG
jgi:hypothetical protein